MCSYYSVTYVPGSDHKVLPPGRRRSQQEKSTRPALKGRATFRWPRSGQPGPVRPTGTCQEFGHFAPNHAMARILALKSGEFCNSRIAVTATVLKIPLHSVK